jgi:hypothetical protein
MTHLEGVHGKEQNRRTVAAERSGENLERKKNIVGDSGISLANLDDHDLTPFDGH